MAIRIFLDKAKNLPFLVQYYVTEQILSVLSSGVVGASAVKEHGNVTFIS